MKNRTTFCIAGVLLAASAVAGALFWQQSAMSAPAPSVQEAPADPAPSPPDPAPAAPPAGIPAMPQAMPQAGPDHQAVAPAVTPAVGPAVGPVSVPVGVPDVAVPPDQLPAPALPADPPPPADPHDAPVRNPEEGASASDREVISGTVVQGETAAVLLNNWLPANTVYSLLEVTRKVYSLSQIHAGQPYTLVRDAQSGEMESFEYEIDSNRKLIVLRQDESFSAKLESIEYDTKLVLVEGAITSSLFQAMTEAGEQASLAMLIAEIFAWEINFIKDLREGDAFSILVEKRYREGEFRKYGKVVAATFTNQGTKYEAYRFADSGGHFRFFNPKGESLEKTLLKAPLPFTRVTSGYSLRRFHPIFLENRPHQGIDYGAPTGTPIMAVGSGTVTFVGWAGGYGKQVIVRHSGRLESLYSHMAGFGRGIKTGAKVRQGQIIGSVGATGTATGPHLDFRLRQNGSFINPAKAINPRVDDLAKKRLPAFQSHVAHMRGYFTGKLALGDYTP